MNPYAQELLERSLYAPVRDFKCRQGKRIRSSLLQISYEMAGGAGLVPAAVSEAIESLHAGSLVIDDVQDDSLSRRGEATLHQRIGIPLAINAGNWMYFHALECLSDSSLAPGIRGRLLEAMIQTARRCHEGQAIDLHARVNQIPVALWGETTNSISLMKTGSLVELAVRMGCISADAPERLLSVMPLLGRRIGIALQMRNDLDELASIAQAHHANESDDAIRDDDLRNARMTWPWFWASQRADHARCWAWAQQLDRSRRDRWIVAIQLFELVGQYGDHVVDGLVSEQLRLMAEHVIDRRLLDGMSDILLAIRSPSWPLSMSETIPAHNLRGVIQ
ncbi:MAG: polyprenyl synthetase family protein [Planctomycetes bacterium]|nr:polyprenyl synthetase family protein [Planctomycetota bacterium]